MQARASTEGSLLPVEMRINGRAVRGRPGQTVLELVREQELDRIPTLCHDPRLPPFGSCFLCVVEIKGAPGLLPSCTTLVRDGMEVVTRNDRILRARRTALSLLFSDHYADCVCPGQLACPAGVDVQGYLGLARLGHYREALRLIKERNPLPSVCGRVCVRKCEAGCRRNLVDEPVGINHVKRFVADHASIHPERKPPTGKRVAIVGGGPAGLTCAYYLSLQGHSATILEALPRLGGMLRYGIPSYRLPRAELDGDIEAVLDLDVEVCCNKRLGEDFRLEDLRQGGFDAVFLGLGAPVGRRIGVPGDDAGGAEPALDFLRDTELHGPRSLHGKVVVVGGGNSAVDAARTAVRCGADEVIILYRRTRNEMPAAAEEVDAATQEGVRLEMLAAPVEVIRDPGNGRVRGIRCIRMELGEPDGSGRRRPVPVTGSEFQVPCSFVLAAIGQGSDPAAFSLDPAPGRPATGSSGTLEVNRTTMACDLPGVFAGGDVVDGPSAVIDAIAQGRLAAEGIDGYLRTGETRSLPPEFFCRRDDFGPVPARLFESVKRIPRRTAPIRPAGERRGDFEEVEGGLSEAVMNEESDRCMECGCKARFTCDLRKYAVEYGVDIGKTAGAVARRIADDTHPLISFDGNKCILCGRCIRACGDVLDLPVLGFMGRGFDTTVAPALGRTLAESECIGCGACVETCPTGALTAKLPYGRQGPWESTRVPSACGFCSLACPLDLHVVADGLLWATSPHDARNGEGNLCAKGRFGTGMLQGAGRIRTPLIGQEGRLVEADWTAALREAGRLLQGCRDRNGPGSIAVLASPRMTLEERRMVTWLARDGLGTDCVGSLFQLRRGGARRDLDDFLGRTASTASVDDLDDAEAVLLVGADPGTTHPVLGMRLRRAVRGGTTLVVLNSRETDLVRLSGLWLDPRRGTAGVLLAELLRRVLLRDGAAGRFAGDMRDAPGLLERMIGSVAPGGAANACGVDFAKLDALAEMLVHRKKVVAIYDLDDSAERASGDLALLARVQAVTGHLLSPGGGLLLLGSDLPRERSGPAVGAGARLPDGPDADRIRGALVLLEDPLSDPDTGRLFDGLEALVVADHFLTRTAGAAQVVLPASTLAETEGTVASFDGTLRKVAKACNPPAGRTTAQLLRGLAEQIGYGIPTELAAADRADCVRIPRDLDLGRIRLSLQPGLPARRSYATMDEAVGARLAGHAMKGAV